jgi:hypothetical protein
LKDFLPSKTRSETYVSVEAKEMHLSAKTYLLIYEVKSSLLENGVLYVYH